MSDLYIPMFNLPGTVLGNKQIAHRYMNVEIGNETVRSHFLKYMFQIFCTVHACGSLPIHAEIMSIKLRVWACTLYSVQASLLLRYPKSIHTESVCVSADGICRVGARVDG